MPSETTDAPRDEPLTMTRPDFRNLPEAPPPAGYGIRPLRADEVAQWTDVQRDAEPVMEIDDGLFEREFGADAAMIEQRCFVAVTDAGEMVGVASGWHSPESHHPDSGRVHWVAVRPSHQRRGLARALLAHVMKEMANWHGSAWLATSTSRLGALRLYLDFGFTPEFRGDGDRAAWRRVAEALPHPALLAALRNP
jgi:ribosomal protein S18 acetylase RimI-like enzyme